MKSWLVTLNIMTRTEPSSFLYAGQQKVEIDETRIGLPAGNGSVHPVIVQEFFPAQELG
jgi:hypothetical protein